MRAGQVIGEAVGFVSAPVHSPASGTVRGVDLHPHPLGTAQPAVEIETDGEDAWADGLAGLPDPFGAPPDEVRRRILDAGIVGMGGAAFPTHVKLSPPPDYEIDAILLNGAECEPYLTADHRLMVEEPGKILSGLRIILSLFGLSQGSVGVERNKPDAIEILDRLAREDGFARVVPLRVKYPQGAEKQLVWSILGREVPSGALPMAVGVVVQNVGTAAAIAEAVLAGRPLVERVVTVTGPSVCEPKNLRVRVGTPLRHVLALCGGLTDDAGLVIAGGPMMGIAQHDLDAPVTKGTSAILCLPSRMVRTASPGPCIGCGRCIEACPMGLSPTTIRTRIDHRLVEEADEWNALDCIECGCCSYVCPALIPRVQSIRYAKGEVMAWRRKHRQG